MPTVHELILLSPIITALLMGSIGLYFLIRSFDLRSKIEHQFKLSLLLNHGYSLDSYDTFLKRKDLPEGLALRAVNIQLFSSNPNSQHYIIYDTADDKDGFMLMGENLGEILDKAFKHIFER